MPARQELIANMDLKPIYGHASLSGFSVVKICELLADTSKQTDSATMYMQLYYILDHLDFSELALEMQDKALALQRIFRIYNNNASDQNPIRLLAFVGRGNLSDNTPLDYITDHCNIQLDLVYILDDLTLPPLIPDHDAVIVALGEKNCHKAVLHFIQTLKSKWPKAWLNDPMHILLCARDKLYERLKNIPNLIVPETLRIQRSHIDLPFYPATIRPVDTHSGKGLQLVYNSGEFITYIENSSSEEFYVSRFYKTERKDDLYRKFRIALIAGKPYICHVALSDNWIVHYISAKMYLSTYKMDEEKNLMEQFQTPIFSDLRDTLHHIAIVIGLDFVVLDCEITSQNKIVLYEADNRGWIHATDTDAVYSYKKPIMAKVFEAFRNMVLLQPHIAD